MEFLYRPPSDPRTTVYVGVVDGLLHYTDFHDIQEQLSEVIVDVMTAKTLDAFFGLDGSSRLFGPFRDTVRMHDGPLVQLVSSSRGDGWHPLLQHLDLIYRSPYDRSTLDDWVGRLERTPVLFSHHSFDEIAASHDILMTYYRQMQEVVKAHQAQLAQRVADAAAC